jgi:hypothetical protein
MMFGAWPPGPPCGRAAQLTGGSRDRLVQRDELAPVGERGLDLDLGGARVR